MLIEFIAILFALSTNIYVVAESSNNLPFGNLISLNKYPDLKNAANRRLMYAYLSTLSQLAKCKEKYPKEEKEMTDYIKTHGNEILKDKRVPKRDKFGIISLKFGFGFYKFIWRLYLKITKRF